MSGPAPLGELPGRQVGPRWESARQQAAPGGGPGGSRPAAPRPPRPLSAAGTRTHAHTLGLFSRCSQRSQKFGASAGGENCSRLGAGPRSPRRPLTAPTAPRAPGGPRGVRDDSCCGWGLRSFFLKMKAGTVVFAASPGLLLLPPPPPLHCTFKWKIFRSQQKHCVQKRLSRCYHQTQEETLPGKLPFGRKYWGICLFIGREIIPRRERKSGYTFSLCS